MKFRKINCLLLYFFCFGCNSKTESPEGVLRNYIELIASGKCEEAKKLTTDEETYELQGTIDAGCNIFETKILEVHCKIESDTAWCCCHESRDEYLLYFHYYLEKVEGKWMISGHDRDFFILDCWAENPWW